jgi:multidrug efflux pump subunit AcrA (membrane-fusion protein)
MAWAPDPPFLDNSPQPWVARGLVWVLLALFAAGVPALVLMQVPETVAVSFVLVAERGADPVRTLHDGIVTSVRVADAQAVEPGSILFTISSESVGDRTAERAALGTSLSGGQTRLANERQKYENQRRADDEELGRLQQRQAALASQAVMKERQVEIAREIADRQQRSYQKGLTSWIEASKPRLEAERLGVELDEARAEAVEAQAAMARLRFEMASGKAAFDEIARSVREELERNRMRKGMLDGETSREGNALTISAPCRGIIVNLVVKNAGTVVRSSDVLAEITCRAERLQAELMVPQRGLALLRAGQLVKLRYDAFPYQRFGVRHATLRWISPAASLPSAGGSFRAIADLDEQTLQINGAPLAVLPGMAGRASIVVGRRTLASYAIEPLQKIREAVATGRPAEGGG